MILAGNGSIQAVTLAQRHIMTLTNGAPSGSFSKELKPIPDFVHIPIISHATCWSALVIYSQVFKERTHEKCIVVAIHIRDAKNNSL